MSERTCSIDGCENRHEARGWCCKHYDRWKRHGDPLHEPSHPMTPGGYTVNKYGYIRVTIPRGHIWRPRKQAFQHRLVLLDKMVQAHRAVYELTVGPIPDG